MDKEDETPEIIYITQPKKKKKKNEIKPSAATWTQLQIFIVSEVNQETHV